MVKNTLVVAKRDGEDAATEVGQRKPGRRRILVHEHEDFINSLIDSTEGDISIREIKEAVGLRFPEARECSISTIRATLRRRLRMSKKLASTRSNAAAKDNNRYLKIKQFLSKLCSHIIHRREVWSIDEAATWVGRRTLKRWTKLGTRRVVVGSSRDQPKLTLLLAVSSLGRFAFKVLNGPANSFIFAKFVQDLHSLYSLADSCTLLDNVGFHKSSLPRTVLASTGTHVLYLPPYYPEGNFVELVFGFLKRSLGRYLTFTEVDVVNGILDILKKLPYSTFPKTFKHSVE